VIQAHIAVFLYLVSALTALAGTAALLPRPLVARLLPLASLGPEGWFFVRHWGVLVVICGALLFWAAGDVAARPPLLSLVAVEKFCFSGLVFTRRGTALFRALWPSAVADLVTALVFTLYVFGTHT
jgi:hypothetical protein